eukprot:TRINITY_DN1288_c0_g1_i10.p2 TRINITY_DN1288_c0_g1~~TRINITY_DN1288_c0_g1_i10.p2  ORF type:complete len:148 (+),score=16.24 TRINITY_DN1288_c0_g1_i10:119-562(+)
MMKSSHFMLKSSTPSLSLKVTKYNARSCKTLQVMASSNKTDIKKQGLESINNNVVQNNLKGQSRFMEKKDWIDSSGRKGTGKGVYQFAKKYGANVDGYSPIYTPDIWSESGDSYKLGRTGLIAWAGLVVVLLGVGVVLILQTSQLGS